jgi:hypothetical protein
MRLIKFITTDGRTIYINPELVFSVAPSIDYQKAPVTAICSVHDECYYHVKETAEEVVSMLTGVIDVYQQ